MTDRVAKTALFHAFASRSSAATFSTRKRAKIVGANAGGKLSLGDALSLLFLMAAKQDERFERAALVWHARFEREVVTLTFEASLLALSALAAWSGSRRTTRRSRRSRRSAGGNAILPAYVRMV